MYKIKTIEYRKERKSGWLQVRSQMQKNCKKYVKIVNYKTMIYKNCKSLEKKERVEKMPNQNDILIFSKFVSGWEDGGPS